MTHLIGGISSAGRALPPMDGRNFLASRAEGPYVFDEDGRRYVDTAMGFGATFLGHTHPEVVEAVQAAISRGSMPAYAHALEEEAAAALAAHTGALSQVIFLNSGSEAVHLATRAACATTGRRTIAKLASGYDGWFADMAFGNAGTVEASMRANARPRQGHTVLTRFNDLSDAAALFAEEPDLAAVIVEPVMANAGCIEPDPEYLQGLADMARRAGAMVIADEVLMGFRIRRGLACEAYGVTPDLATLGKAIGNGFAVAALVGTPDATAVFRDGRLRHAGTYNGNPVACAAVSATMNVLTHTDYDALLDQGNALRSDIEEAFERNGLDLITTGYGTVFTPWRSKLVPITYDEASSIVDAGFTLALHHALRRNGVISMPAPFGRHYLSTAHDAEAREQVLSAFVCAAETFAERGC